jgi:chromosomal replication initiation ATPase DnaA
MILPSQYIPNCPADFIGPARKKALMAAKFVANSQATGDPLKLFFSGPPGVGKSSLIRWVAAQFDYPAQLIKPLNGTQITMEFVEQLSHDLNFGSLFSKWRVVWVDEFDQVPTRAQARLLTVLDTLPKHNAFLVTCNSSIDALEQRVHSRFNAFAIEGPTIEELTQFLISRWNIRADFAANIAQAASKAPPGELLAQIDVRQALRDADGLILQQAA